MLFLFDFFVCFTYSLNLFCTIWSVCYFIYFVVFSAIYYLDFYKPGQLMTSTNLLNIKFIDNSFLNVFTFSI